METGSNFGIILSTTIGWVNILFIYILFEKYLCGAANHIIIIDIFLCVVNKFLSTSNIKLAKKKVYLIIDLIIII